MTAGSMSFTDFWQRLILIDHPKRSKIMHNRKPDSTSEGHATELFTGWAEQFIRESAGKDEPFFCYLAYNAVHGPLRTDKSKPASAPEAW